MSLKKRITFTIVLSSIGIVAVLVILYFYINHIVVLQEVNKARIMSKFIYSYRDYLASVAPDVDTKAKNVFRCTPAYVTNQVAKLIRNNEKIYIKQVSDNWRNPNDKPNKYEMKAIEYFKKTKANEFWSIHPPHKNVKMGGDVKHIFYAYPLYVEKSCLVCHGKIGKDVPKRIYKILHDKYGDRAFNYKVGDVRGILSIRLPYQKVQDKILSVFMVISTIMFVAFTAGTIIFYGLSKNITDDIDEILKYFREKIKKNIYDKFDKKMHFSEFDTLKKEINKTVEVVKDYQHSLTVNPVSGILNRYKFFEFIKNKEYPIIVVNIDKFREINSYFNPEIGDKLIKKVSEKLKKLSLKYGFEVFHLDIDEFAIVPTNIESDVVTLREYAQKILNELERQYEVDNHEIMVRFRMGISHDHKDYIRAEMALDKAKKIRKDIVFGFEAVSEKENYGEHLKWLKKLKTAIDNDKIVPYFQPIVDSNKKIVKYEALVRMIDEDGNVITPYYFLDVAKKSRFYLEITKIMFTKILDTIEKYKKDISINLTIEDLENIEMRNFIFEKLKNFKYPQKITFEIVENEDIRESEVSKQFLEKVKDLGVELYIDDFGSGYANFDYLLSLNPNGIKIDGSIIKKILHDKNSQIMVKTLINFKRESNIKIVAEFVENKEIFDMLKEMGVDYFQGYYISPPTPFIKG